MPPVAQPPSTDTNTDPSQAGISTVLAQMIAKHGPLQGTAYNTNPTIPNTNKQLPTDPSDIPNPNPTYRYTFQDGTTMDATWDGGISALNEKSPTAGEQAHPNVTDASGNVYIWNKDSQSYGLAPGLPQGTKPAVQGQTRQAIDNGYNVTQTYDGGGWVTTSIGSKATPGASNPGDTRPAIENGRNVTQTYDGTNWRTTSVGGSAVPGAPDVGATRQAIENGRNVTQTYDGTNWRTTGIGSSAVPGAPQQGQTRQTVDSSGRTVTQTYDGSNWVNTAIAGVPKEGDTRQTIQSGRYVTETYSGGSWVPTSIGANATPGAANKGDTRQVVEGGYNVTQTYDGQNWTTTSVGTKATPTQPVQVNAPATEAFLTTYAPDTGKYTSTPNPSYAPTTMADVAGQVARLQSAAQAQRDQISADLQSGKYGTGPDAQQKAAAAFDSWWSQNVEPQKAQLQAAQQQAQLDQQQKLQEQQRANLQTAQTAAGEVLRATQAAAPPGNSPAYAAALGGILKNTRGAPQGVDYTAALSAPAPDYNKVYEQATAQALAHISPTAAQIATGQPVPTALGAMQGADISGQLNRTSYDAFGNPQPQGAPPPPPAPVGGPMSTNTMNVGAMPGAGPTGQQSTPLPYIPGPTNPPPVNIAAMPGAVNGQQSTPLPYLGQPYVYGG